MFFSRAKKKCPVNHKKKRLLQIHYTTVKMNFKVFFDILNIFCPNRAIFIPQVSSTHRIT